MSRKYFQNTKSYPWAADRSYVKMTLLILLFAALWIAFKVFVPSVEVAAHSDFRSMMIASNILEHSVFSSRRSGQSDTAPKATCDSPPGYPLVLAGFGALDSTAAKALKCFGEQRLDCQMPYRFLAVIIAQYFLVLVAFLLGFLAVWRVSGSLPMATLAVLLLSLFGKFDTFAEVVRPEGYLFVTVFAAIYCSVVALKSTSWLAAFFMQLFYGMAALFNPIYIFSAMIAAVIIVFANCTSRGVNNRPRWPIIVSSILGIVLSLCPWLLSPLWVSNNVFCADSYLAQLFAQRLAYNAMDWATFSAAMVYWLPGFGDGLAKSIFSESTLRPLALTGADSFLRHGSQVIWPMALKASNGDPGLAYAWLVRNEFMPASIWHLFATLPLTLRGVLGAGDLLALVGLFLLPQFFATGKARGDLLVRAVLVLPVLLTTVLLAALTPNQSWHCLPVVLVFAYVIADRFGAL